MANDIFGNPNGDVPPSISDDFASIARYRTVPYALRDAYHQARVNAMIGRGTIDEAWAKLGEINAYLGEINAG